MLGTTSTIVRSFVFSAIDGERDYMNMKYNQMGELRNTSITEFVTVMQDKLSDAAEYALHGDNEAARDEIRKVLAAGVACLEVHGILKRR